MPLAKIGEVHGQASWVRGRLIVPMYHPAAALHQPSLKPILERDFKRLPGYIEQAQQAQPEMKPNSDEPPARTPRQMSQPRSSLF